MKMDCENCTVPVEVRQNTHCCERCTPENPQSEYRVENPKGQSRKLADETQGVC